MAKKLLKQTIDAEIGKPVGGKVKADRYIFDTLCPGFALRVRNGVGSYWYLYRFHGKSQKVSIDAVTALALDKARDKALLLRAEVKAGINPVATRRDDRQRRLTVEDMLTHYLADFETRIATGKKRGRQSTLGEFRRIVKVSILPALGSTAVEDLDVERVARWHAKFSTRPVAGNRALSVCRSAFAFGMKRSIIADSANPFAKVDKFLEVKKRERLTLADLEKVGVEMRAALAEGSLAPREVLAFKLLLYTGLRRSELLGFTSTARRSPGDALRWGDVDLDAGLLKLRQAKTGARVVLLAAPVVDALRAARPVDAPADACVIPGDIPGRPMSTYEQRVRKVFDRAGVVWHGSHSLRRTFASIAAEQLHPEFIVGALLGHRAATVTAGYMLPGADPLRSAVERIAGEIASALDGRTPAPVLDFKRPGVAQ